MIEARAKITVQVDHPNKYRTPVRGELTYRRDVSGKTYLMMISEQVQTVVL